jgi:Peptidase of plants and bacteria
LRISLGTILVAIVVASWALADTAPPATAPATDSSAIKTFQIADGKYSVTINTTETPDLTDWADNTLAPVVAQWYPKLVAMLPTDGYTAPTHFTITFWAKKKGVADTVGTRINCAADFYRHELKREAVGSVIHEMVHVVQQYGSARHFTPHPNPTPPWLVEGIPDYIRWYLFEPQSHGADINQRNYSKANYDGMYRISANFLNFVTHKYDPKLVEQVNDALRRGVYTADIWPKLTGKTLDELNKEWKIDLAHKLNIATQPAD